MKILLIQEASRHIENKEFRESLCLQRALGAMGHEAEVWGLNHPNFKTFPDFEAYDLIVNCENYDQRNWVPKLGHTKHPKKFLWVIDAHIKGLKPYRRIRDEGKYDLILQSTKEFVIQGSVWFPNGVDDTLVRPIAGVSKDIFLGFCGTPISWKRQSWISFLQRKCFLSAHYRILGEAMVRKVNSFHINFNHNLKNDINFRSFETIACRTVLLTNENPQYSELGFKNGINCLIYKNRREAVEMIRHYLHHMNDLIPIAEQGYALSRMHTYEKRAQLLLDIYGSVDGSHQKHCA